MKGLIAILPPLAIFAAGALITCIGAGTGAPLLILGIILALFGALDASGRFTDYLYLSRFTYLPTRMADYYGKSFCGRWVVSTAHPIFCGYYHDEGYRFWHFLPDGFPRILFLRAFWRHLIFGHRSN